MLMYIDVNKYLSCYFSQCVIFFRSTNQIKPDAIRCIETERYSLKKESGQREQAGSER